MASQRRSQASIEQWRPEETILHEDISKSYTDRHTSRETARGSTRSRIETTERRDLEKQNSALKHSFSFPVNRNKTDRGRKRTGPPDRGRDRSLGSPQRVVKSEDRSHRKSRRSRDRSPSYRKHHKHHSPSTKTRRTRTPSPSEGHTKHNKRKRSQSISTENNHSRRKARGSSGKVSENYSLYL